MKLCVTIMQNNNNMYIICILQLQLYLLTMASKSSTVISCHQHRVLLLAREIPFFYTHSYPYICCIVLCDRNSIITASSVYRRMLNQKVQWNYSVGERKLIFQKVNSRTPTSPCKVTKLSSLPKTTVKESPFQLERLVNIHTTLHHQLYLQCQFLQYNW